MSNLLSLTPAQLRKAAEIPEQIEALNLELANVFNGNSTPAPEPEPEA